MTSHTLDIYDADLHLATTKTEWQAAMQATGLNDTTPKHDAGKCYLTTNHDGTRLAIILWINVKQHDSTADLVNTLAHEASHAANQLLDHIGHQITPVDEPHAWLIGWLTSWMYQALGL